MNQHQLEVALLDQKHRRRIQIASFIGAAVVAIAVLWGAGVPLTGWFTSSPAPKQPEPSAQAPIPIPGLIGTPTTNGEAPPSLLAGTDSSISKVPLALQLISTAPGRNIREGTAAIGVARENPQTYMAGALLDNGTRLREIHKDFVVLERDGQSTRLYLDAKKNSDSDLTMVGGPQAEKPVVATSNESLTDYLRPNPVYDGQILRGYEVYAGQKVTAFEQLGLQNGDLITSLNNAPFSDPGEAFERFNQLMSGAAMVATIDRQGEPKTVTLDGSIIVADLARASDPAPNPPPALMGM